MDTLNKMVPKYNQTFYPLPGNEDPPWNQRAYEKCVMECLTKNTTMELELINFVIIYIQLIHMSDITTVDRGNIIAYQLHQHNHKRVCHKSTLIWPEHDESKDRT